MRLRDKFRPFAVLRAAVGALLPTLALTFVVAGAISSPAAGSAILSLSSGTYQKVARGETWLRHSTISRAPDRPAECFERDHPCGPGAISAVTAEPLVLGLTRRASIVTPRAPERVPVPDVAPHLAASLSILFRNFRK